MWLTEHLDDDNKPQSHIIYQKLFGKAPITHKPSKHLIEYLENQNIDISSLVEHMAKESGESVAEQNAEALNINNKNINNNPQKVTPNQINTSTIVNKPAQVQTIPVQNVPKPEVKQVVVNQQATTQIPRPQVVTVPPIGSN